MIRLYYKKRVDGFLHGLLMTCYEVPAIAWILFFVVLYGKIMRIYCKRCIETGYSVVTKLKRLTNQQFATLISNLEFEDHVLVSSGLTKRWSGLFNRRKHIMFIDCDSTVSMIAISHILNADGIGHTKIVSSEGHYWFICDFIGSFQQLYSYLLSVPGVDNQWLKMSNMYGMFTLRAYTGSKKSQPIFGDVDTLKSDIAINFFNEFRNLHESDAVIRRINLSRLQLSIDNGTAYSIYSNPDFKV